MASKFAAVEQGPPIEVFQLTKLFAEDAFPNKVNLSVGAYRDEKGKPWVLPVVRKVEKRLADDETLLHEYLPVLGLETFSNASVSMLLGRDSPAIVEGRAFGVQTLSGTGALRLGSEFLQQHLKYDTFYYSNPTWEDIYKKSRRYDSNPYKHVVATFKATAGREEGKVEQNHHLVFMNSGFKNARQYRYWDTKARALDFDGLIEDLNCAPENAVIILHACAHNPTGMDPTQEQWKKIAEVMKARNLFPFFDSAYQGFASGDLDKDAWAVRYFVEQGFELVCAQSFAKNFGLYNERVGNLAVVMSNGTQIPAVKSQMTWIVRGMYSNPPAHGARVVSTALGDDKLYDEWRQSIKFMSCRVLEMRDALRAELMKLKTPGSWDHITKQIGLFSYTGLTKRQSEYLVQEYHIYLLKSGRINICGLNPGNVQYVAKAMNDAIAKFPGDEDYPSKL